MQELATSVARALHGPNTPTIRRVYLLITFLATLTQRLQSRPIISSLVSYNVALASLPALGPAHAPGNGCSAVLDQLFYSLMDEGEAVLIAAP